MGYVLGIDLGTTYSAIAQMNQLGRPEVIPNREGEALTPSVVQFQDTTILVGTMAKRSAALAPLDTVEFAKRGMGDPAWRFETSGGTSFRPEEISAIILRRLKEDAELLLGRDVSEAVITVPAYFDDAARRATRDAGAIAGLSVERVVNEPTAAALAYGVGDPGDGTVVVYDLGGGTFDITVMRICGGDLETLATSGDRNLGGFDWDNALMQVLNDRFQKAGGSDLFDDGPLEADLRERAEIAKRALSIIPATRVVLSAGSFTQVVTATRLELEDVTSSLLSRTRDITQIVLEDAGLRWNDIDRLLLAGGSTRMPAVRTMMEETSGLTADRTTNPDQVVALGAAVQAALVEQDRNPTVLPRILANGARLAITDVTSQGLGVLARDEITGRMENAVIITPNTRIPAKANMPFRTVVDDQTELRIQVTQGDDLDPAYVKQIGEQVLPIPPYPAGAPLDVVMAYDIDQTVFIEVTDLTANRSLGAFDVYDVANMTEADKASAKLKIRGLEIG